MADVKDYNRVASNYQKRLRDPNWTMGKKADLAAFSKGASTSGGADLSKAADVVKDKASRAWKALTE
jgi:hypothetical protein